MAELYIVLIKEAIQKGINESDLSHAFWEYCFERRTRINNLNAQNMLQPYASNSHTSITDEEGDILNIS